MFAVVPGAQGLLDAFGWRDAFIIMAIAVSLLVPLAWGYRSSDRLISHAVGGQSLGAAIREAGGHGGFWLLTAGFRSEEHTSELQSLMRISYAVFCLKKKKKTR